MQSRWLIKLAVGFCALAFAGCNSSSQTVPGGAICAAGYDPIPIKPVRGEKPIPTDPNLNKSQPADSQMKPGTYTYNFSDIVYTEKGNQLPLKIQFHDAATNGASVKQGVICTENAKAGMNVPATEADAVTDVIVCNDFHQVVRSRKFKWDVTDTRIHFGPPVMNEKDFCNDSAQKVYGKDEATFMKDDEVNYEIRSTRDVGQGTFNLAVHMAYAPFPNGVEPKDCTQCVAPTSLPKPKANPGSFDNNKDKNNPQRPVLGR